MCYSNNNKLTITKRDDSVLQTYLLLAVREISFVWCKEGFFRYFVAIHPLAKVIGEVVSSVVVGTVLKINERNSIGNLSRARSKQNISFLHVVVSEHHGRLNLCDETMDEGHFLFILELAKLFQNRGTRWGSVDGRRRGSKELVRRF